MRGAGRSTTDRDARPEVTLVITDATAPRLLGMSARAFREAVVREGVPHARLGKRVVVHVDDLRALARAEAKDDSAPIVREATTAEEMLEELGFRRTA